MLARSVSAAFAGSAPRFAIFKFLGVSGTSRAVAPACSRRPRPARRGSNRAARPRPLATMLRDTAWMSPALLAAEARFAARLERREPGQIGEERRR
eukprot:3186361-Alexandrium_andersonii.AAC.1